MCLNQCFIAHCIFTGSGDEMMAQEKACYMKILEKVLGFKPRERKRNLYQWVGLHFFSFMPMGKKERVASWILFEVYRKNVLCFPLWWGIWGIVVHSWCYSHCSWPITLNKQLPWTVVWVSLPLHLSNTSVQLVWREGVKQLSTTPLNSFKQGRTWQCP